MSDGLSRRASAIEVSPTVAVAQKAAALRAAGEKILDFSVGEPDQPTAPHIRAAAQAALDAGKTRYTPSAGLPELRAAVATRYREDDQVTFAPEEVVITTGGKHALYVACQALLDEGDEVIVPTPYWPTFAEAVRLAGGRPILAPTREKDGFRVTATLIDGARTSRTRAVILNTPSNPTGAVVDAAELRAIADVARRRDITVLFDDTYARLTFGTGDVPAVFPALGPIREILGDRFVILGTASKTYCMTGWRIGWVMGPKRLADASAALISHSTQCPTTFAQHAAVEALNGPQDSVREMAAEYRRRRDFVYPAIHAIERVSCAAPGGGFYVFPNVTAYLGRGVPTSLALAARLLDETRVAVVPGEGFGVAGYFRLSFARPMEELREGVGRIADFLRRLDAR
jgi:aspartate aminotransferase